LIEFKLENGFKINLEKSEKVFTPTGTTETIIEGILENNNEKRTTLDLGCGCGVIGLSLFKNGLIKEPLYASDVSDDAVKNIKLNASKIGCEINAMKSNLFSSWEGKKFETIVCDVSSISDEVAKISPWFSSVECETGLGGDKLINEVFKSVPTYAEKDCKFYFPIISLSDVNTIKTNSKKYFKKIKMVKKKNWPLPETMLPKLDLLRKLKEDGKVDFKERFGIVICYTEVYEATIE